MKAFYVFLLLFLIVKATTVSKPITKNIDFLPFPEEKATSSYSKSSFEQQ